MAGRCCIIRGGRTLHAAVQAFLDPQREFHRAELRAPFVEQRHEIAVGQLAQDGFSLGRALLLDGHALGVAHVGQGRDREFAVEIHAPGIQFHQRGDLLRIGLAYDDQFDVHVFRFSTSFTGTMRQPDSVCRTSQPGRSVRV